MVETTEAEQAALVRLEEGQTVRLQPHGFWGIGTAAALEAEVDRAVAEPDRRIILDLSELAHLDTSGAWLLRRLTDSLGAKGARVEWSGVPENARRLLDAIGNSPIEHKPQQKRKRRGPIEFVLGSLGRRVVVTLDDLYQGFVVFGDVVAGVVRSVADPKRLRWTSIIHHLDHTGLQAVPIVFLMSFLIGGIIAQQGAFQLRTFGATLFVVDLVGVLVLREIGVLLTAIMLAGRSGSAYTAEIGSMKMREEIDAIKVIGLHPIEILVVPRIIALVIALPLLTFISDMAALMGGAVTAFLYVDMSFAQFIARLRDGVALNTLVVGLVKAPFMALIVGVIAANEGLQVKGSAESLGQQTTASVVKSIFMVIVADGLFAIFFAAIGY